MQARVETLDITVLAGGPGREREVSLDSGQAVAQALRRLGHHVVLADIGPGDLSALDRPADFVFIALHGEFGEDGTVQAELDARGLPYSGSRAEASRVAMDKVASKRRFEQVGIPTPRYEVVESLEATRLPARFPLPAVVKPIASGSSVDTTIVRSTTDLRSAVGGLVDRYGAALVERYVAGPELTVGILDDQALPVIEVRPKREFYDYQAKYVVDDTEYVFDIELPGALLKRVQALSLQAHGALGCEVFSRVDWMVEAATLEPYILEINTIPGFTSHSLVPKAAARIGLDFDWLCQRIVELSLKRGRGP
ncbi:MAG: D-alanine--D-alanine ligase [Planctomycetes bacterium]|nr:D-alanine--D-alanine ligase [Planctomycetota bacterium]